MYAAGGIAIAYYAGVWGARPVGCDSLHELESPDPCGTKTLTAFCSILSVSHLANTKTITCVLLDNILCVM